MKLDALRLDSAAVNGLNTLKRDSGIETRNVVCRWVFCRSLAQQSEVRGDSVLTKRDVEISWDVFAGEHAEVYLGLLKERCKKTGKSVTRNALNDLLSLHVHRGIGYLLSDRDHRDLPGLVATAVIARS